MSSSQQHQLQYGTSLYDSVKQQLFLNEMTYYIKQ